MNRLWLSAAIVACTASCGSLPPTHFYRLSVAPASLARTPIAGVLSLQSVEADTVYSDDRIVYRSSPYRLDYYNYHRWAAPPATLLADALRAGYDRSGLFRRVVTEFHASPDAVLSARLTAFDEVDRSATSWIAQLDVELWITDPESSAVLWRQQFTETEPIQTRSPEGLAAALSRAMAKVVGASAPAIASAMQRRVEQPAPANAPTAE